MICRHVGQAQTPREESIFYLSQEKKIVAACVDGCLPDWLWWLLYNIYKHHIVMLFTWTNIMIYVNCISVTTTTTKNYFPFGNEKVARKLFCQVCKCHLTWLKKKKIKSHPIPIGVGVAWFKNLAQFSAINGTSSTTLHHFSSAMAFGGQWREEMAPRLPKVEPQA